MEELKQRSKQRFLKSLQQSKSSLEMAWKRADESQTDQISLPQFRSLFQVHLLYYSQKLDSTVSKKEIVALYNLLDSNKLGFISKSEFMKQLEIKSQENIQEREKEEEIGLEQVVAKFENITQKPISDLITSCLVQMRNPERGLLLSDL